MPNSKLSDWDENFDDFTGKRTWTNKKTGEVTSLRPSYCGNCGRNTDYCDCQGNATYYDNDSSDWGRPGGGFQGGF